MATDTRALAADLSSLCASARELDPDLDGALAVDGVLPRLWCEPATPEELGEVLELADRASATVIPRGGGTRMGLGQPPRSADILLSTRGLSRVIEYEPADLTVTVEAGIGLLELSRLLEAKRQMLALDPPAAEETTIGGVVASNASGPIRLQYGSARDLVIGIRVANADGVLTKAGGRVVKNVAGYDLNKLYTGSLGTVGVIVELSFKLHPMPRSRGSVVASFPDLESAASAVRAVMRSPLGPTAIEALDFAAARAVGLEAETSPDGCALLFLIGGFERAVTRVAEEIAGICREQGRADVRADDQPTRALWDRARGLLDAAETGSALLKLSVPPSRSIEALGALREGLRQSGFDGTVISHAGVGLAYARIAGLGWDTDEISRLVTVIREARAFAAQREGSLVVENAPAAAKRQIDVWGEIGPPLRLMQAIKEQLDPKGTLNPGRYVGGI